MKMDEFLLDESFMKETERICLGIPTEPEEMRVMEFNGYYKKLNDMQSL